jgi:Domain of unknown function (DUF4157)/Annexin
MTRQNATQTQQQAPTSSILSKGGILQRKCESCGQHTIAGGECSDCNKKKGNLQRKLSIGASDDPLELEADRVADQVMSMSASSVVNNAPLHIQRFTGASVGQSDMMAPASVDRVLSSPGSPLEPGLQQDMGQRFGHDFSQVRVHTGGEAARSAQMVNANAYTVGQSIIFGERQYMPHSSKGKKLLAHELVHTLQQKDSSFYKVQCRSIPFEPTSIAQQLKNAMEGLGTDEESIYAALSGRTQSQIDEITAAYLRLTSRQLQADLEDELTSDELRNLANFSPSVSDKPEHRAEMVAEQLYTAMKGLGTDETAIYSALNGRTSDELTAIKAAYLRLTKHQLIDDLQDELSGNELQQALGQMDVAPTVYEKNTELGGLSMGNFDFHFKNCAVIVWVWLKFQFTSDMNSDEQAGFKKTFINAVHGKWAHSGYSLAGSGSCPCSTVPIEIHIEENSGNFYHKLVDVEKKTDQQRRPKVINDINVNFYSNETTYAHEFGHVLGLYDEYDGGFFENIMFWHKNQPYDKTALMNSGTELRPRYFEQYRRRVQETAPPSCEYSISTPAPKP